jgi:hypothetical protein
MGHNLKNLLPAACAFLLALCISHRALGQQNLPDGKGKEEFVHNCTACHRAEMVTRVKKTPEDWRKSVDEMASRGTDGTKEDLDNAYIYLVTYYAKDASDSAPPAHPAPSSTPPGSSEMMTLSQLDRLKRASAETSRLLRNR